MCEPLPPVTLALPLSHQSISAHLFVFLLEPSRHSELEKNGHYFQMDFLNLRENLIPFTLINLFFPAKIIAFSLIPWGGPEFVVCTHDATSVSLLWLLS